MDRQEVGSLTLPSLDGGGDHAAELLLERAGAQQEAGMLFSVNFPKRMRETSNAIAMLPKQALKIRHCGRLLRDERTEVIRMLQGLAEANQVDLYLTHMLRIKVRLNDADPDLCAKLGC